MSEPFVGQLKAFPYNFAPRNWAFCNGAILPIQQNLLLFSLLGTTYGGDGKNNFALPNLQGRTPIGFGQGPGLTKYALGEGGGQPATGLQSENVPPHTHSMNVNLGSKLTTDAGGSYIGAAAIYVPAADDPSPNCVLNEKTIDVTGDGQEISVMQPYIVVNWCIALQGIFPPRG